MQLITPADAAGRVTEALKSAAQATGAGFDYLVRTAKRESALNPAAQNPSSSARGLFQFIDSTWLEVLKEEGANLGLGDAAASVQKSSSGRYVVQDPAKRAELLAMRDDPQASALVAGAFTRRNAAQLTAALGRPPSEGELYAAHFLGAKGASQLVSLASASPDASAAAAFPAQASANRAIFFDNGRPRSASEVYDRLTAGATSTVSVPSLAKVATGSVTRTTAVEDTTPVFNNGVEDDKAAFHSLFKTGRRSPVSAYVAQAWSSFGEAGLAADVTATSGSNAAVATPAYAPQPGREIARSPVAAQAVQAVNNAAAPKRRAAAVPVPTPREATAQPSPAAASSVEAAAARAAPAAQPAPRPGGLIAFLKTVFAAPATAQAGGVKSGGRP
ncbi:lytic transglycosylase domain-containing protein [Chelatococcus sambhunathii]|uniref:Lytic transglycosylase domain-containing protein n=1 Tax=Chelatococcus sambhunathii TaxID=363953 RepID=A0ABU1DBP5_9HYPH|nr:lytic transglycosylase domain-containing protein [Chelatococcus sambhunathii]MDR4305538.1 lytic transglycosylase domain-containing protein [Chelatococcus sambhunathii]